MTMKLLHRNTVIEMIIAAAAVTAWWLPLNCIKIVQQSKGIAVNVVTTTTSEPLLKPDQYLQQSVVVPAVPLQDTKQLASLPLVAGATISLNPNPPAPTTIADVRSVNTFSERFNICAAAGWQSTRKVVLGAKILLGIAGIMALLLLLARSLRLIRTLVVKKRRS